MWSNSPGHPLFEHLPPKTVPPAAVSHHGFETFHRLPKSYRYGVSLRSRVNHRTKISDPHTTVTHFQTLHLPRYTLHFTFRWPVNETSRHACLNIFPPRPKSFQRLVQRYTQLRLLGRRPALAGIDVGSIDS